jgi:hypothetical protein
VTGEVLRRAFELRIEASAQRTFEVMTEEAAGIARYGDLTGYVPAIQKLAAS